MFILTWLICITNELLLVSLIRNWQIINIITSFLPFLYMFLSPIYYSYKYLPYYLYLLVYMVPLTPCIITMKSILDNDLNNIWINLSIAIILRTIILTIDDKEGSIEGEINYISLKLYCVYRFI